MPIARACSWILAVLFAVLVAVGVPTSLADSIDEPEPEPPAPRILTLEEPPLYGQHYDRYEPTIYTGFAPRTLEEDRIHLHVGRGNQLRVTVVLSREAILAYPSDLLARVQTLRALVDDGRMVPTQNDGLATLEAQIGEIDLAGLVAAEAFLSTDERLERNLALLERRNPGRVFRIAMAEERLVRAWLARIEPGDRTSASPERRLELANAMLPARLWLTERGGRVGKRVQAILEAAPTEAELASGGVPAAFSRDYFALLDELGGGRYPRSNGQLEFVEFTAVYPIGTFNDYTEFRGKKIPLYPTPGRRALTTHQRTKTVDHIPTVAVYSYSPWLPYMHVGKTMHNSFHTLWWRMQPEQTAFLPKSWLADDRRTANGAPSRYLWLLSRGPMSHGCTHLTTGHIAELRQLLPSETAKLYEIDVFLNRSYDYDVFDIDGDFTPEVMGVHYFIAYSLRSKKPHRLRTRNERHAYYRWLYAGNELDFSSDGGVVLHDVQDGRYIDRTAAKGSEYPALALHEAGYEPERFQFYKMVDIEFARELRKVGVDHPFQNGSLARAAAP